MRTVAVWKNKQIHKYFCRKLTFLLNFQIYEIEPRNKKLPNNKQHIDPYFVLLMEHFLWLHSVFFLLQVHVNLMVLEARMQAELLYALRTVNRYMTN